MSVRGAAPRRSGSRWLLTFLAWSSVTVLWSSSVGLGGSPDEPTHMVKAAATTNGQLTTAVDWGPGAFGSEVPRTRVLVPDAFAALHQERTCWTGDTAKPASCMPEPNRSRAHDTDAVTYVGTYPPVYYLAVGWPSQVLDPPGSMYGMRIASALLAAAFLAEGFLMTIRRGLTSLGLIAAALAVPASVLFLSSTVNPNGLEVAAAFCLWAAMLALGDRGGEHRRRNLVSATVSAIVLSWLRPLGPAYALIIVGVSIVGAGDATSTRWLRSARAPRMAGAAVGLAALAAVAFAIVNRSYSSLITYAGLGDRSAAEAAGDAVERLGGYLIRSWGLLGWQGVDELLVPAWITLPWLAMVAGLAVAAMWVGTLRDRLALALLVVGCVFGPIIPTMASPATPWQGRYMLPLLVGVPLLCASIIGRSDAALIRRVPPTVSVAVLVFCSGAHLIAHQHLMNRTAVGLPARPLATLTSGSWTGPISPPILFVWAVTASTAWVVMMKRSLIAPSEPAPHGNGGGSTPPEPLESAPDDRTVR